jgi:hypothetical protein
VSPSELRKVWLARGNFTLVSRHPLAGGETLYPNSLRGVSDFTRPDRKSMVCIPFPYAVYIRSNIGVQFCLLHKKRGCSDNKENPPA